MRYCTNCKYSRKEKVLPGTGTSGQSYYFYCINPGRGRVAVFEHGCCGLYQSREESK